MKKRLYNSGSRWALWRWTFTDTGYITRLHVLKTPWFAICLHWLNGPDPEPFLHDHPVTFLSLILRGGYAEKRRIGTGPLHYRIHRWCNVVRASLLDRHTIVAVEPKTVTLAFMGPGKRTWGFHTRDGWTAWKPYNDARRAERAERAAKEHP